MSSSAAGIIIKLREGDKADGAMPSLSEAPSE